MLLAYSLLVTSTFQAYHVWESFVASKSVNNDIQVQRTGFDYPKSTESPKLPTGGTKGHDWLRYLAVGVATGQWVV